MALKTLVLIGVIATVGVYFTVRIFPKQEYPETMLKLRHLGSVRSIFVFVQLMGIFDLALIRGIWIAHQVIVHRNEQGKFCLIKLVPKGNYSSFLKRKNKALHSAECLVVAHLRPKKRYSPHETSRDKMIHLAFRPKCLRRICNLYMLLALRAGKK